MDKELSLLVERLERIFPNVEIKTEAELFSTQYGFETDCVPPQDLSWYDIILKLRENGLEIRNIKEK